MKYFKTHLFLLSCLSSLSSLATVSYDSIQVSGNGCSPNTISTSFSPTQNSASILFDQLLIQKAPYQSGPLRTEKKECQVDATFHANYDEQYVVLSHDWRGFVFLPAQASASFQSQTSLSYKNIYGSLQTTTPMRQTKSFQGPTQQNPIISSTTPESSVLTECGESFTLHSKMTLLLTNRNTSSEAQIGADSLDLSQQIKSSVQKVACRNPWKATLEGIQGNALTIKVTTEKPKINQLGSLYVAASYQNQLYVLTPQFPQSPWTALSSLPNQEITPILTGNAPATFQFQLGPILPEAKGAVVYVGVGYGADEKARLNDLLNTKRYQIVYTVP